MRPHFYHRFRVYFQLFYALAPCDSFQMFSNDGSILYHQKGNTIMFPHLDAYYNPNYLVNIISLDLLQAIYHTVFNSAEANAFTVHVDNDHCITFQGFSSGLY